MTRLYSMTEAADALRPVVTKAWLRGHIDEIPHLKMGTGRGRAGRIGFTDAHLEAIIAMHEVQPVTATPPVSSVVTRRRAS